MISNGISKKIIQADEDKIKKSSAPIDRMADAFKTKNGPIHPSYVTSKKNISFAFQKNI